MYYRSVECRRNTAYLITMALLYVMILIFIPLRHIDQSCMAGSIAASAAALFIHLQRIRNEASRLGA